MMLRRAVHCWPDCFGFRAADTIPSWLAPQSTGRVEALQPYPVRIPFKMQNREEANESSVAGSQHGNSVAIDGTGFASSASVFTHLTV